MNEMFEHTGFEKGVVLTLRINCFAYSLVCASVRVCTLARVCLCVRMCVLHRILIFAHLLVQLEVICTTASQ